MDIIQEFEKSQLKRKIPRIKPGDTVKIHQKIKEGEKERVQIFTGTVIRIRRGFGINGNVTVRKVSSGVGVEKTFPFHLASFVKIEVLKRGKVRRAKLYFLHRLQEKAARLKENKLTEEVRKKLQFESVEEKQQPEEKKTVKQKNKKSATETKIEKKTEQKKS